MRERMFMIRLIRRHRDDDMILCLNFKMLFWPQNQQRWGQNFPKKLTDGEGDGDGGCSSLVDTLCSPSRARAGGYHVCRQVRSRSKERTRVSHGSFLSPTPPATAPPPTACCRSISAALCTSFYFLLSRYPTSLTVPD